MPRLLNDNEENLEDNVRNLLAFQDEASHNNQSEELASEWMENLSLQMLLDGDDDRHHHENLSHSIYNPATLLNICMACLVTDTNHEVALKICKTLKAQISRRADPSGASTAGTYISTTLDLLMAFAYL